MTLDPAFGVQSRKPREILALSQRAFAFFKEEMMNYAQQIKDPRWQRKRLEVLELHNFQCQKCRSKDEELHVHHPFYKRWAMIWEYDKKELECLCHKCHKDGHEIDEQIKKELAICINKPLILAYIMGLNASNVKKAVPNKSLKDAVDIEKFRSGRKSEEEPNAKDDEELELFYSENPQFRPHPDDTADQQAEKFFARMKLLT